MSRNKLINIAGTIARVGVEFGTGIIVHDCLSALSNRYVKHRTGIGGVIKETCITAASTAIAFKTSGIMGEYVSKQTDNFQESFDDMVATLDNIIARTREDKTEEDSDNGEANTKDSTETSNN
jgi:hypothetical protein